MRGCPNQCRFCQARSFYHPFRRRTADNLVNLAQEAYQHSGYEEVSLLGLSLSDYPDLTELVERLTKYFKDKAIGISLPSLKAKTLVGRLASLIASIKKTGLTFAPEAATERLRGVLRKNFSESEFLQVMEEAYAAGYQRVKLYFLAGLPFETDSDLEEIIAFALKVSQLRKKLNLGSAWVNVSVNTLIPKPHTPFQWFAMESMEGMRKKQALLKDKLRGAKKINLNFHSPEMSFLEGVLSRGDRRLSRVILRTFRSGARFEAWENYFQISLWNDAFKNQGIDPLSYLLEKSPQEILPWDFLDLGIEKNILQDEFQNCFRQAEIAP
jgi:radical SAM superfamily enzyme YgiQ (UPF0313 family)